VKVIWSDFASKMLVDIFKYYKEAAGENVARKIKSNIFSSTKQIIKHPNSGQIEPLLTRFNEGHRYIVVGYYKIIYKQVQEGCLITDIFDSWQNPTKMNKATRKPR
jgi:plasmid stabilization system protein ParE